MAQIYDPASWKFLVREKGSDIGSQVTLEFKVELADTWLLYSTDQDPEVGPIPAEIEFEPHESYELVGDIEAIEVKEKFDSVWLDNVRYLDGKGTFNQKVKILSDNPRIKGTIKYQVCTTVDGMCIYPEQDFVFSDIVVNQERDNPPKEGAGPSIKKETERRLMEVCEAPMYADFLHLPYGLKGYFNLEQAKACAKIVGKPILIDFTGHGCANCRVMEKRVWSNPEVLKRLKEDYVVVALYVDDRTELPPSKWYESSYDGKIKKTIGKQNADYQITKFNNNAQPFYVLMDHNGHLLSEPKGYDLDAQNFVRFLDQGKAQFKMNR